MPGFSRKIIGSCVQKQKEKRLGSLCSEVPVLSSGALGVTQITDSLCGSLRITQSSWQLGLEL